VGVWGWGVVCGRICGGGVSTPTLSPVFVFVFVSSPLSPNKHLLKNGKEIDMMHETFSLCIHVHPYIYIECDADEDLDVPTRQHVCLLPSQSGQ